MTTLSLASGTRVSTAAHHYLYPLWALVRRELKKRYAVTALGLGWTIVQPLVLLLLYVLVFGVFMKVETRGGTSAFVMRLLAGMLPYLAVSDGLLRSASALREDRTLLDRASFPAVVVPGARILTATVAEIAGLLILLVVGGATATLTPWTLLLPVLLALQIVLTLGLAWIVSVLAVFIPDFTEMLALLTTAWLFLTPIFYDASQVPEPVRGWLWLNPLHALVSGVRAAVFDQRSPLPEIAALAAWAIVSVAAGRWFFRKTLDRAKDFL